MRNRKMIVNGPSQYELLIHGLDRRRGVDRSLSFEFSNVVCGTFGLISIGFPGIDTINVDDPDHDTWIIKMEDRYDRSIWEGVYATKSRKGLIELLLRANHPPSEVSQVVNRTFSFPTMLTVISAISLMEQKLSEPTEEYELIEHLTGVPFRTHEAEKHFVEARIALVEQFPLLGEENLVSVDELIKNIERAGKDGAMRKMQIDGWLRRAASRLQMDCDAYYMIRGKPKSVA